MEKKLSMTLIGLLILMPTVRIVQSNEIDQALVLLDYFCENLQQESINIILLDQDGQDMEIESLIGESTTRSKSCNNRPVAAVHGIEDAAKFLSRSSVKSVNIFFLGAEESFNNQAVTYFNRDVWIVPDFFLSSNQIKKLRLDSQVFTYQKVENSTMGEKAYIVKEIYSIKSSITKINILGTWDLVEEENSSLPSLETMWERRANLSGVPLIGMSLTSLPFTYIEEDDTGNVSSTSGLFFDILWMLQEMMEFDIQMKMPWDGKWGSQFVIETVLTVLGVYFSVTISLFLSSIPESQY